MPAKRLVPLVLAGALVAVLWLAAVAQAVPSRLIALGAGASKNTLYSFAGNDLNTVTVVPLTGLGASSVVGISFRPADGQLYGVGINGNEESVFRIDPGSGAASLVGSATQATIGGAPSYGVDFNPVSDRLRVVSGLESNVGSNANNFRLNPNNGAIAGVDTDLNYGVLPGGEAGNRPLATIALDRNFAGATATTVFGLTVAANDSLVRLGGVDGSPSPNGAVLTQIGPLGVDTSSNAGLDIDPATGEAYAVLQVGGATGLYGIDLATGAAALVGKVAGGAIPFSSLAIAPPPPQPVGPPTPDPTPSSPPPSALPPAPVALLSLKLKPYAFAPASSRTSIAATKASGGATVTYAVSGSAGVSFRVERAVPGKARKFTPLKSTFTHNGQAGVNSFRFSGKVNGRALAPGRYRLTGSLPTASRSVAFKVLDPARRFPAGVLR